MQHPAPASTEVQLSIHEDQTITAIVMSYELNSTDTAYHYSLQAQFDDGNNAATVQINDVHQSLVKLKED